MKTIHFALAAAMLGTVAQAQVSTESPAQTTSRGEEAAAAATSSSQQNWLIGRWVFDEEHTRAKHNAGKGDKEVGIADAANALVASQLLEKMKGASLTVTTSEITMTRGDGNGKSDRYTLLPGSDPNVLQLKQENGEVLSFHREGERVWMSSTGSVNEPFFFKKAS